MFEKMIEKLKLLAETKPPFDPSRFGDPIAMQTQWTPAKGGGASFRTHKLEQIDMNILVFKASAGAMLFYSIFMIMGITAMVVFPLASSQSGGFDFNIELIMPCLIGMVFVVIGGGLFYFGTKPIVFDKYKGYFCKGRRVPDQVYSGISTKDFTRLSNIHALQLISEYCRGNKSSYYSYELNLILKDGKRINVVDHGNPEKLREDAQTLSGFLGVPVWDAI